MVFAAGLGTRLGGLTRDRPKALLPVAGVPILELVARRLIRAGARHLIINVHHHAAQIVAFVESRDSFGVEVSFSHEQDYPLETGGGLREAARLFRDTTPFFLHNGDVLTDLPLESLMDSQTNGDAVATLAVMQRQTSRYLLFDDVGLVGREDLGKNVRTVVREPTGEVRRLGFTGVQAAGGRLFEYLAPAGVFSIIDSYLAAAGAGELVKPFFVDGYQWIDIGKPADLEAAQTLATTISAD